MDTVVVITVDFSNGHTDKGPFYVDIPKGFWGRGSDTGVVQMSTQNYCILISM